MDNFLERIAENLIKGQASKVKELTQAAIDAGVDVEKILNKGMIAAMSVVGEQFKANEIYIPEVLLAAKAMRMGVDVLEPLLIGSKTEPKEKIVLGTVKGDVHDSGKNLVGIMLKGFGFEVIDLGVDVTPQRFIDTAEKKEAKIIGMSALLTTSMPYMKKTVEMLKEVGLKDWIKTMIGGAVVTQSYADEIGADGYGPDAYSAVEEAKRILGLG